MTPQLFRLRAILCCMLAMCAAATALSHSAGVDTAAAIFSAAIVVGVVGVAST